MAVSSDGNLLAIATANATSPFSNAIQIYDVKEGRELRTLQNLETSAIAFSPDGKLLATAGKDEKGGKTGVSTRERQVTRYSVRLWFLSVGMVERTLATSTRSFGDVAVSSDGIFVAAGPGSYNATDPIMLCDVTGTNAPKPLPESQKTLRLAISPDNQTLAAETELHGIKLWDLSTGRLKGSLTGNKEELRTLRFSPDSKFLVAAARDRSLCWWDLERKKQLHSSIESNVIEDAVFNANSQTFLSVSTGKIQQWNVNEKTSRALFEPPEFAANQKYISIARFTPDGSKLITGKLGLVQVTDLATGHIATRFARIGDELCALRLDAEGAPSTLIADNLGTAEVWDLRSGVYRGASKVATFCDTERGLLAPDSRKLATHTDSEVVLHDANNMNPVLAIKTGKLSFGSGNLKFSPDSKLLAVTTEDDKVKIYDVATGKVISTIFDPNAIVPSLVTDYVFSPDETILAESIVDTNSGGYQVALWDVATGKELRRFLGHGEMIHALAFSADGKLLASGDLDGVIKVWDTTSGNLRTTLEGHQGQIVSLVFGPQNILYSSDGTEIILWDWTKWRFDAELCRLVSFNGTEWLVITPEGLFDGSPAAWSTVLWRFGPSLHDVAPAERFFNEFYYPNLLPDILAGRHPLPPRYILSKDRREPALSLTVADTHPRYEALAKRSIRLRLNIAEAPADADHDRSSGARDVRLFRNGILIKAWRGDLALQNGRVVLETDVPLVAGENRLTAYAFNRDNVKSVDTTVIVTGPPELQRKGVEYILALGINEYANPGYTLKYAVADAQDFGDEVRARQAALGQYERVEVIALSDRDATKEKILAALKALSAKVQPEDAVIVYFAGHGVAAGNRFYLVPHDLGYTGPREKLDQAGLDTILSHSISDEELQSAVEGIDAGQMLMVIDACNSGQALEAEEKRRGPMNSKGLAQLAYEKGMYILTAAQSYQAALEASKLGHGYLTYALVEEGLKSPAADTAPKDGSVLLREWLDYATARVPALQQQKLDQSKQTPKPPTAEGQRLLLQQTVTFTNGEENVDPAQRTLQRPRVFYRREAEPTPLVVARP